MPLSGPCAFTVVGSCVRWRLSAEARSSHQQTHVEELDELGVGNRTLLELDLDGLSVVGHAGADLAVVCGSAYWSDGPWESGLSCPDTATACFPHLERSILLTRVSRVRVATSVADSGLELGEVAVVLGEEVLNAPL